MKERPILFNPEMVRSILEGRKTQTRRMVKNHEICECGEYTPIVVQDGLVCNSCGWGAPMGKPYEYLFKCPFGQVGDRLWVRETTEADYETSDCIVLSKYKVDGKPVLYSDCEDEDYNGSIAHWDYPRDTRPNIHMPKWAARIFLEITDVRVERLQDISEDDAEAEGIVGRMCPDTGFNYYNTMNCIMKENAPTAHLGFRNLWDSIYKNWHDNPWVWVVEFKVVEVKK